MLKTEHINFDVSRAWFARHSVFLQITNTLPCPNRNILVLQELVIIL